MTPAPDENRVLQIILEERGSDLHAEIGIALPASSEDWTDWRASLAVEFTDLLKAIMRTAEERLLLAEPELTEPSDPKPGRRRGRK